MISKVVIIANSSEGLFLFRRTLIEELIKKEIEVTCLTPFDGDTKQMKMLGAKMINVPVDRRGTNPVSDFRLINVYRKYLKRIRPDLVITYTIKPNVYGGIASRILKIPYAANITGLGTAFEKGGIISKIVTQLNRIGLKQSKVVFFENEDNRNRFVKAKIVDWGRTYVLKGAGVDLEFFSMQPYPTDCTNLKLLFMGRIMKEKGINELIEAINKIRREGVPCELDILGIYEEDYREILEKYEKAGWLHYHGFQKDVRPFIKQCHCFVLPSYHEGMANTNLECAACGRPVITSDIPGCKEAIIDGVSGYLCESKNSDSLYDAITKIAHLSNQDRQLMGNKGREYMEKYFDKRIVVANTINKIVQSFD